MEDAQKYIGVALQPPAQIASGAQGRPGYVILPQQPQEELVISDVHTMLDYVLNFFQQDVGYVLLDDAQPGRGGGVQLGRQPSFGTVVPRAPHGGRSVRVPDEVLDEDRHGVRQTIRFSPDTARYAQCADDLVLVARFTNVLDVKADLQVRRDELCKTVLKGIRLMHLCSYDYSDLVVTLAYASTYFKRICEELGHQMSEAEASHVCVLLIFLAHCYVIDESCPLKYWQQYVFKNYCTLKVLDAALFRIFEMRDFELRISAEEERHALSVLLCAASNFDVILSAQDSNYKFARTGGATPSATSTSSGGPEGSMSSSDWSSGV